MRLARLAIDGSEVAAIAHPGALYRLDRLDEVLGAPLPLESLSGAHRFGHRVLALAMAWLDEHAAEIDAGTRLDDCQITCPPARWLPPCGESPALYELRPGASLPLRLEGRTLRGHGAPLHADPAAGPLRVSAALGLIVTEDLHLPSLDEAHRALGGHCLALAWTAHGLEQSALAQQLGPAPGRVVGTHLGPWLQTGLPADTVALQLWQDEQPPLHTTCAVDPERCARVLCQLGRHTDLIAGDVLLVLAPGAVEPRGSTPVHVASEALGQLSGPG